MLWNSILSAKNANFITADFSNCYFGMPMERQEFMCLPINIMKQEITNKYNLQDLAEDGWVYCCITRGMYGLPHAGLIANKQLKNTCNRQGIRNTNSCQAYGSKPGTPLYSP